MCRNDPAEVTNEDREMQAFLDRLCEPFDASMDSRVGAYVISGKFYCRDFDDFARQVRECADALSDEL